MPESPQPIPEPTPALDGTRTSTFLAQQHPPPTPALSRWLSVDADTTSGGSDASSDAGGSLPDAVLLTPPDVAPPLPPDVAPPEPRHVFAHSAPLPGIDELTREFRAKSITFGARTRTLSLSDVSRSAAPSPTDEASSTEDAEPLVGESAEDATIAAAFDADADDACTVPVPGPSVTGKAGSAVTPDTHTADTARQPGASTVDMRAPHPTPSTDPDASYSTYPYAQGRPPTHPAPIAGAWAGGHAAHITYGGAAPAFYDAPPLLLPLSPLRPLYYPTYGYYPTHPHYPPYGYYPPHPSPVVPWPGAHAHALPMPAPAPAHMPRRTPAPSALACAPGTQARLADVPDGNQLDLVAVAAGRDLRTTLMVKNIPSRMSPQDVLVFIQEVVPGQIDFFYLPIDFSTGCNFGYAFVNFIGVKSLLEFASARLSTQWGVYRSRKVVLMCYAKFQGKAELVEWFRNRPIMGLPEALRPRTFYSDGRNRGQPEPFPEATHPRHNRHLSANVQSHYSNGARSRSFARARGF